MLGLTIKLLIDHGFSNKVNLNNAVANFIFFSVLFGLATAMRIFSTNFLSEKLTASVKEDAYEKILNFPVEKFDNDGQSQWINFISNDIGSAISNVSGNISVILRNMAMFVGSVILLIIGSWKLSLVVLLIMPIILTIITFFGYKLRNKILSMKGIKNVLFLHFNETISFIKTVKLFSGKKLESEKLITFDKKIIDFAKSLYTLRGFFVGLMITLMLFSIAAVLYFGGKNVVAELMTIGALSSFIFHSITSAISVGGIIESISDIGKNYSIFVKLQEIMDYKISDHIVDPNENSMNSFNKIIFKNLSFRYPRNNDHAFKNVNFEINRNEKISIVGKSGSGKTSIINILLRFYDNYDGEIIFCCENDKKIEAREFLNMDKYLENFAVVTQEIHLFSDTIYNNLTYGTKNPDINEIDFLLKALNLHDYLYSLPEKLDTKIGDQSAQLSTGQKQRILIIRALLRKAKILILDESTSALDEDNEEDFYDLLFSEKCNNLTIIFITHKLNFLNKMDRVVSLDQNSPNL